MNRESLLRHRIEELKELISAMASQIDDITEDIDRIAFQLDAHDHDQQKYAKQYWHLVGPDAPIVSLREYRALLGDLEFMQDLIAGLKKKQETLIKKRKDVSADCSELIRTREQLTKELDVILSRGNVLPFPNRNEPGRDEDKSAE